MTQFHDPDVQFAHDEWRAGRWSPWQVCDSISRQWCDRHPNLGDSNANGIDDDEEVNAHGAAVVALFTEAAAACAAELAGWIGRAAVLGAALVPK